MRRYPALNVLSPGLGCVILTVQGEHGRDPLTVGDSSGIGDAVLPQVGEVVGGGQHDAVHLGPGPDLSGHGGADQDPAGHADHEAADLHVHHHRPVAHGGGGKKIEQRIPAVAPLPTPLFLLADCKVTETRNRNTQACVVGRTGFVYIITCFASKEVSAP